MVLSRPNHSSAEDAELDEPIVDLDEASEVIPFTYSIAAYGADYPVDSLVKRVESGDIIVPRFSLESDEASDVVGFQREYVWPPGVSTSACGTL